MAVNLSPIFNDAQLDSSGDPASGFLLYTYAAGSSSEQTTYQDSDGDTAHANPIELNSRGEPPAPIWLTAGQEYKFILKTAAGVTVRTVDNVSGINDTSITIDEWTSSGQTATYVSSTSFTLVGDQTTDFHVGRRLKITDSGGTKYATIKTSAFTTLTTITLSGDALETPISAVSMSILRATDTAIPSAFTTKSQIAANQDDYDPGTGRVVRISSDARRNITGFSGGFEGRELIVHNVGTFPIVFKSEDTGSVAANRFAFGKTLGGGQTAQIIYDSTSARWRAINWPKPIGEIVDFGGGTLPEDCLAIDQNVSRTIYAALYNEVGTTWGSGDGSTTFGLYVGKGAALIAAGQGTQTESGDNDDVDTTNDTLTVTSNTDKWITGMAVTFNLTSGTITGLSDDTTYYVIRASSTTIKLASSLANAQNGTAINFTAKSSPVWDITHTYTSRTLGERLGEEDHAMSSSELLAHQHTGETLNGDAGSQGPGAGSVDFGSMGSVGGNAAMNIMQPSSVVTRGVRYC